MHQISVVKEYLVWLAQCLKAFVVGMELTDECCTFEEGKQVNELVAGGREQGGDAFDGDVAS